MSSTRILDKEEDLDLPDPDMTAIRDRKVVTQNYDIVAESLISQIEEKIIFMRPLSERPNFQRGYVWNNRLASKLMESVLLNVPIPPCYLSQNREYELDVIDGQQRLYSLYRYVENQFKLTSLDVLTELNGLRFFELPTKLQRQIMTHTIRCVLITNESHPEIKFEVFERLNSNTVPLNAQELRNCVYRGPLITMLGDAAQFKPWLDILGRKKPDSRLRDEELILRFFAFELLGLDSYRTPQRSWLNEAAAIGRELSKEKVDQLYQLWQSTILGCLELFDSKECFRKSGSKTINRALFDLVTHSVKGTQRSKLKNNRASFRVVYKAVTEEEEFLDLISRAVDHKSRTKRRFEIWDRAFLGQFA